MHQVQKLLEKIYRAIGTERAAHMSGLVRKSEWKLLQKEVLAHPSTYNSPKEYFDDAVVVELTRKLLLPGDASDRKEAAVRTFWSSESQCCATNVRLDRFIGNKGPFEASDEPVVQFISAWRKNVSKVLGKPPSRLDPCYSQGSTLSDKGLYTTIPDKMLSRPTLYTRSSTTVAPHFEGTELDRTAMFVRANRFFTVPKDSQKDRGCCVEASQNISLQLAVGKWLKRRYRKVYEVDLRFAEALHRDLAQLASITGSHATIDLSNASDTVANKLVKLVLPDDWWVLLNSLRAPCTVLDGKTVWLEKFSSMGNGFTFELETILFRTLCETIGCGPTTLVFGDDIIVPSDTSAAVIAALRFFGFTPNEKKTFCEGPFRESCGGDFFMGAPVRAYYMKELPDEPQKWLSVANGLRSIDPDLVRLHAAWRFCVDQVPIQWRVFGPASLGDICFHDPDAKPRPYHLREPDGQRRVSTHTTLCWDVWIPVSRQYQLDHTWKRSPHTVLQCALMGIGESVSPRDSVTGYKRIQIPAYGLDVEVPAQRFTVSHGLSAETLSAVYSAQYPQREEWVSDFIDEWGQRLSLIHI